MERQRVNQTKSAVAQKSRQTATRSKVPLHSIEEMQALYGNRAVNQLLASQPSLQAKPMFGGLTGELQHSPMQGLGGQTPTVLQAKLEIGAVGDKYEIEADRDAAQELDRQKTPARALSTQEQMVQRQESKKEDIKELAENTVQNGQEERKSSNQTGLPDALKAGVENLSAYSLEDVRVHYNSPKPAQLQALAYTQGTEIHVAPGQEEHLPHEAWHVVQQLQGRVKPTMQKKGVQFNDDERLEKEADAMGEKAASSTKQKYTQEIREAPDLSSRPPVTEERFQPPCTSNIPFVLQAKFDHEDIRRMRAVAGEDTELRKIVEELITIHNRYPEDFQYGASTKESHAAVNDSGKPQIRVKDDRWSVFKMIKGILKQYNMEHDTLRQTMIIHELTHIATMLAGTWKESSTTQEKKELAEWMKPKHELSVEQILELEGLLSAAGYEQSLRTHVGQRLFYMHISGGHEHPAVITELVYYLRAKGTDMTLTFYQKLQEYMIKFYKDRI